MIANVWQVALLVSSLTIGSAGVPASSNSTIPSAPGVPEPAVDFQQQIVPILTKAGCNSGACHGAAVGRGGFRLSLYGGEPEFDHESIKSEFAGRRVNLVAPEKSLILLKATESISHGGGTRLQWEGPEAKLLERWIRQGAVNQDSKSLKQLIVTPSRQRLERVGQQVALRATARFDDDTEADVTAWTVFTAEDPSAVEIDPTSGQATLQRVGRQVVVARYMQQVVPIELLLPLPNPPVDLSAAPRRNFVDDALYDLLTTLRIPISAPVNDAQFMRRISLDLTGRLPAPDRLTAFLEADPTDQAEGKRERLVDELLESEEFVEYWTFQFAKWLRIRSQPGDAIGARTYHDWLKQAMADNLPYDQLARTLLTSAGDTHQNGPANFFRTVGGAREQAEFTSELFMGSRLRCANCHNHPLDRWTQDDYHGLAAIFARLERGRMIREKATGEVTHPRTGEAALPRIPGEHFLTHQTNPREALAAWLTDSNNPYFAQAIVNRLWKALMGRGLVEPVDDFRSTNPATHPELLQRLAEDFVAHGYDLRHTLRVIATSAAYARSSNAVAGNENDDRYYSRALVRSLEAEVLADAISDVTGVAEQYGEQPLGTRAVELFDSRIPAPSLDLLGRCEREESCEGDAGRVGMLTQKLHFLNGELLNARISHQAGHLNQWLSQGRTFHEVLPRFYLLCLARQPTRSERDYWQKMAAQYPSRASQRLLLEDAVWSLLSCQEFLTNH